MGRTAKGWGLVWRERRDEHGRRVRKADVRFRHSGKRIQIPTGCTTAANASRRAGEIYAEYVAGRWERSRPGPVVNTTLDLPTLVVDWSEAMAPERDVETIVRYGGCAKHWVPFFGTMLGFFDEAKRAGYVRARLQKVVAQTVRYELSSIRGFLRWCKEQRLLSDVPVWPKLSQRVVGTRQMTFTTTELSLEEVVAILSELPVTAKRAPFFPVRDRFIFAYETGLRPATISALRREHYKNGDLHINKEIDKNRFDRIVPLTDVARAALERWLPEEEGFVFGTHAYDRYLKAAALRVLPRERAKTFSAYDLRHMRGTHLAEATGDLPGIAYLLGHLQLTTTNKYMHPSKRAAMRVLSGAAKTRDPHELSALGLEGDERNARSTKVAAAPTSRNHYSENRASATAGRGAVGFLEDSGAQHPGIGSRALFDAIDAYAYALADGEVFQ